jgi:hypothetical protein
VAPIAPAATSANPAELPAIPGDEAFDRFGESETQRCPLEGNAAGSTAEMAQHAWSLERCFYKPRQRRHEINDEPTNHDLPPKRHTELPSAQMRPKQSFRARRHGALLRRKLR